MANGTLPPSPTVIATQVVTQVNLDGVGQVVVTDIVQDPDTNNFVRQVRIFDPNNLLAFTLQISSPTQLNIEFTAPSVLF